MAQKSNTVIKWLGGDDSQTAGTELGGTGFSAFKEVLGGRFSLLVKTNMLMLLFAFPLIIWLAFCIIYLGSLIPANLPYGANYGPGLPVVDDVALQAAVANFNKNYFMMLISIPLALIAGLGLAGGLRVIKLLAIGENITVTREFLTGIKKNFLHPLIAALIVGVTASLTVLDFSILPVLQIATVWKVFISIAVIALLIIGATFVMYYTVMSETYKLDVNRLIKNSFVFTFGLFLPNIILLAVSLLPVLLLLIPISGLVQMIMVFAVAIIGISFMVLIWTVYTRRVFAIYLGGAQELLKERADTKADGMAQDGGEQQKSIDEGTAFEPLSDDYCRDDIVRMMQQKDKMREEIERERKGN